MSDWSILHTPEVAQSTFPSSSPNTGSNTEELNWPFVLNQKEINTLSLSPSPSRRQHYILYTWFLNENNQKKYQGKCRWGHMMLRQLFGSLLQSRDGLRNLRGTGLVWQQECFGQGPPDVQGRWRDLPLQRLEFLGGKWGGMVLEIGDMRLGVQNSKINAFEFWGSPKVISQEQKRKACVGFRLAFPQIQHM